MSSPPATPEEWPSTSELDRVAREQKFDATHWSYLAEGGKSLLVRYTGPTTPADKIPWISPDGRRALALRIEKRARKSWHPQDALQKRKVKVDDSRFQPRSRASYSSSHFDRSEWELSVVSNLLRGVNRPPTPWSDSNGSPAWSPSSSPAAWTFAETGRLSSMLPFVHPLDDRWLNPQPTFDFLEQLANRIEADRPPARRAKDEIDIDCPHIIEAVEDLSWAPQGTDLLCVEIKPKWLFTADESSAFSRYRRHAILKSGGKLTPQEVDDLYEPLDLASRDARRQAKALRALVRNWRHGGNNLRIFDGGGKLPKGGTGGALSVEGEEVLADTVRRLFGRSRFAQRALRRHCNIEDAATASIDDLLVIVLLQMLNTPPFEEIIVRLAYLQQRLCPGRRGDLSHLDELWRLYRPGSTLRRALNQGKHAHPILTEPEMAAWDDFVLDWMTSEDHEMKEYDIFWGQGEESEGEVETTAPAELAAAGSKRTRSDMDGEETSRGARGTERRAQGEGDALDKLARKGEKLFQKPEHRRHEAMRNAIMGALCSGSFKDCSIWIRIPVPPPGTAFANLAEKRDWSPSELEEWSWIDYVTLKLIDVDVKPISKLEHWMQLDEDIEECFAAWKEKHGIEEGENRNVRRRVE